MTQATLTFEMNPSVPKQDAPRLSRQCALILEMLTLRPHTNEELSRVSLKYTSRISDLRANGYSIECTRLDGGLTMYALAKP